MKKATGSRAGMRRLSRIAAVALMLGAVLPLLSLTAVRAATTRLVAVGGADTGACVGAPCATIGYALAQAVSGDTISLAAGTYYEHALYLDKSVSIVGAGSLATIIDAQSLGRIFGTSTNTTTVLSGLTMRHGRADSFTGDGAALSAWGTMTLTDVAVRDSFALGASGGGILARGNLTLRYSSVTNNRTLANAGSAYDGGGIFVLGDLTLEHSVVSGNAANYGGGIDVLGATATLTDSVVVGNTANGIGGGILVENFATVSVSRSTIAYNTAYSGGGIYGAGTFTVTASTVNGNAATGNAGGGIYASAGNFSPGNAVTNSTISGNTATKVGGGIDNGYGPLTLTNVTIAGNNSGLHNGSPGSGSTSTTQVINALIANPGPNCAGTLPMILSQGHNLDSDGSCGFSQPSDLSGTDPRLGPLGDYGGPTQTQALLAYSSAIDAGSSGANGCPATDQRGTARPQGAMCDIGAFEYVFPPAAAPPTRPGPTIGPPDAPAPPVRPPGTPAVPVASVPPVPVPRP